MKRVVYIILASVVLAGLILAGCRKSSNRKSKVDTNFEEFGAQILDYNLWSTIHEPGALGLLDYGVPIVIGKGDYTDPKVYPGEVSWSVDVHGVVKFLSAYDSEVSPDGYTASGSHVILKPVGEGSVYVYAEDADGNRLQHKFIVRENLHYTPDANPWASSGWDDWGGSSSSGWDDWGGSSSSDWDDWGGSSSSEEEEWGSSSSAEEYD